MHLKVLSAIAAAFLLAACQSAGSSTSDTGGSGGRQVGGGGGGTVLSDPIGDGDPLNQLVYFAYDKYDLQPEGRQAIEGWAGYANANPGMTFIIEGHADERGTREYNLALGNSRANSAMEYMTALGIAADRLSVVTYGKERPAQVGSTESAYARNRRSVLVPE